MKNGHTEKTTNIDENCFVSPAVVTVKKQNGKNGSRFTETQRNHREKESTNAEYGGVNIQNIEEKCRWRSRQDMDINIQSGLCVLSTTVIKVCNGPMHICGNRRKIHRLL